MYIELLNEEGSSQKIHLYPSFLNPRFRFAKMRSDVLVKMELLDQKHVQDTVHQMQRLISTMQAFHDECASVLQGVGDIFPIEVDLSSTMLGMGCF